MQSKKNYMYIIIFIGVEPSNHYSESLCNDQQFPTEAWITEGSKNNYSFSLVIKYLN